MIQFVCGGCDKTLRVADDAAGKQGKCPACAAPFTVPAPIGMPPQQAVASIPPALTRPAVALPPAMPPRQHEVVADAMTAPVSNVPHARFAYSSSRRTRSALLGIAMLVGGAGLVGLLLLAAVDAKGGGGRNTGKGVILGLVLVVSGIVFLFNALRHRSMEAATSPEGLSLVQGEWRRFVRWIDVCEVRQVRAQNDGLWSLIYAKSQGNDRLVVVQAVDGSTLELNNFLENLDRLAALVEIATLTHLLPAAMQRLDAGGTLEFGELKVNRQQLWLKPEQPLAWSDVAQISQESGWLKIKASGKWLHWFTAPLGTIPNTHLFQRIADHCRDPLLGPMPAGPLAPGSPAGAHGDPFWNATQPAAAKPMMSRPMQSITAVFLIGMGLGAVLLMIELSGQRNNNMYVMTFFMAMGMLAMLGGAWMGIKAIWRRA